MTDRHIAPDPLDTALDALRRATPEASPGFMNAVLRDALEQMPARPMRRRRAPFARVSAYLGGWRAGVTLAGAAMAGLAVGYLDPSTLDTIYGTALGGDTAEVTAWDEPLQDLLPEGLL